MDATKGNVPKAYFVNTGYAMHAFELELLGPLANLLHSVGFSVRHIYCVWWFIFLYINRRLLTITSMITTLAHDRFFSIETEQPTFSLIIFVILLDKSHPVFYMPIPASYRVFAI